MEWYTEAKKDEEIEQGDIFFKCPIFLPDPEFDYSVIDLSNLGNLKEVEFKIYTPNVIVLTQSCDIVNEPKADNIIVARITDVKEESNTFLKEVLASKRPPYQLLGKKDYGSLVMNYMVVDFSSLYSVPRVLLEKYKDEYGSRIRLNSPYLELLSQKFGNFFSRVGLPENKGINKEDLLKCANIKKI